MGDLHQPFHALGVGRGGNDIPVGAFGVTDCGIDPARPVPCNLHAIWDSRLIGHRGLDEAGVDRRLAVAGLRLAAELNRLLTAPPPAK